MGAVRDPLAAVSRLIALFKWKIIMAKKRRAAPSKPKGKPKLAQDPRMGLAALGIYLFVLVVGVAGELLDIQWIRTLPID
jgi:hypothetical protein